MIIKPPLRGIDAWGSGAFGARRRRGDGSTYSHKGVDVLMPPGSEVYAPVSGRVARLGRSKFPGPIDLLEISAMGGDVWKVMYCTPAWTEEEVEAMPWVIRDKTLIGKSRSLQDRYPGIPDHLHIEVRRDGDLINPTEYLV